MEGYIDSNEAADEKGSGCDLARPRQTSNDSLVNILEQWYFLSETDLEPEMCVKVEPFFFTVQEDVQNKTGRLLSGTKMNVCRGHHVARADHTE